jgi:hypothetical protein
VVFILQIPFREAHGLSGCCVALTEKKQCKLSELTLEDFKTVRYIFVVKLSITNLYIFPLISLRDIFVVKLSISNLYIFPLISLRDILSINKIPKIISRCYFKCIMMLQMKTITLYNYSLLLRSIQVFMDLKNDIHRSL